MRSFAVLDMVLPPSIADFMREGEGAASPARAGSRTSPGGDRTTPPALAVCYSLTPVKILRIAPLRRTLLAATLLLSPAGIRGQAPPDVPTVTEEVTVTATRTERR